VTPGLASGDRQSSLRVVAWRLVSLLAVFIVELLGAGSVGAAEAAQEMVIDVARSGEAFVVDALLFVPVPRRDAWAVLTDFDRISGFVPNLSESATTRPSGNRLVIAQKGVARFGPLSFPCESVREVELHSYDTVRSRNARGNMRQLDSVAWLGDAGGGTRIGYHVQAIPGFWFPGVIGEAFLRHEVREQFEAIVKEMLRRKGGSSTAD
jgi:hypothetical protein